MATISNNDIARAIYVATKDKTNEEQSLIFKRTVKFLANKRLIPKASEILSRLKKIINDEEGKVVAKVWSKEKINENTKKELIHNLSKHYAGKTVILEENLDEKLLGGFKIEVNDEVIDLTVKNKLKKLQAYLTR